MAEKKNATPKLIYESQESWYNQAVKMMNADELIVQFAFKIENYLKAAEMFEEVGDYEDAAELAEKCRALAERTKNEEKEYKYQLAVEQKKQAKTAKGYEKAEKLFNDVPDYKDVKQLMEECHEKRVKLEKQMKVKKMRKLGLMAMFVLVVVGFFVSPAWENLQNRVMPEKIEDPIGTVETTKEKKTITIDTASIGDKIVLGDEEWFVLEADENQVKLILLQQGKEQEQDLDLKFTEKERKQIISEGMYSCPIISISKK